jgi:hypothetical protein
MYGINGKLSAALATKDINYAIAKADSLNALIVGPNKHGGKGAILFKFRRIN